MIWRVVGIALLAKQYGPNVKQNVKWTCLAFFANKAIWTTWETKCEMLVLDLIRGFSHRFNIMFFCVSWVSPYVALILILCKQLS